MRKSEKREGGSGKEVGELGSAAESSGASSGCRVWVGGEWGGKGGREGGGEGGGGRERRALKA